MLGTCHFVQNTNIFGVMLCITRSKNDQAAREEIKAVYYKRFLGFNTKSNEMSTSTSKWMSGVDEIAKELENNTREQWYIINDDSKNRNINSRKSQTFWK